MSSHLDIVANEIRSLLKERECVFKHLHEHQNKHKRYGWEKWLQVELAVKLAELGDPKFEVPHKYRDNVKRPKNKINNTNGFIDLVFRVKNTNKDYSTALEIKIDSSPKGMSRLIQDFRKIRALSSKKWNYRSVIGVLAYDAPDDNSRNTRYSQLIKELSRDNCIVIDDNKYYNFVIIGWEPALKDVDLNQYTDWVKQLENKCREVGIPLKRTMLPSAQR